MDPSDTQVFLSQNRPQNSFQELQVAVSKNGYFPQDLAIAMSNLVCKHLGDSGQAFLLPDGTRIGVWNCGLVALAALGAFQPDGYYKEPDTEFEKVLGDCLGLSTSIKSAEYTSSNLEETKLFLIRTMATQFSSSEFQAEIAKSMVLIENYEMETGNFISVGPHDQLFQEAYGCSSADYLAIMQMLWVLVRDNSTINFQTVFSQASPAKVTLEAFGRIVSALSVPITEVGTIIRAEFKGIETESLPQAFYSKYPFVLIDAYVAICPPHSLFQFNFLSGVWFKTLDLARKRNKEANSKRPEISDEGNKLSDQFESFCLNRFGRFTAPEDLFGEYYYSIKKGEEKNLSPDVIAFYGDNVVLVECKIRRLKPGTFFGYSYADFQDDLKAFAAKSLIQPLRFMSALAELSVAGKLNPKFIDLSERILKAKRVLVLGIGPALPPIFHFNIFRNEVESQMNSIMTEETSNWVQKNRGRVEWHYLDLKEIECFIDSGYSGNIFEAFTKFFDYGRKQPDFRVGSMKSCFRDWVLKNIDRTKMSQSSPEFILPLSMLTKHCGSLLGEMRYSSE